MVASTSAADMTTGQFVVSNGTSADTSGCHRTSTGSRSGRSMRSQRAALPTVSITRWMRGRAAGFSTRWLRHVLNTHTSPAAMWRVSSSTVKATSGVVWIGTCTRRWCHQ